MSDVKNPKLAEGGRARIAWAWQSMRVLQQIRSRFLKEKPLKGLRVAACLHVTTETANLMTTLRDGGAAVRICASNPLSTQDDVAAALAEEENIESYAINGENSDSYYKHILECLAFKPHITMDDGADLTTMLHTKKKELIGEVIGGTEETTTGVIRLKSMADQKVLSYPVIAVNDAATKHFFDNRYGTGQSTIDGIIRGTNRLLAGSQFVVAGYGWCGKGLAMRARGMGARVIVTEIDPLPALEAVMDGFEVLSMNEAAAVGDFFCTVTGNKSVLRKEHFAKMKDGAIISNSGHFNVEIDLESLAGMAKGRRPIKDGVEEFAMADGRKINVLAEGRLVNLALAEGHPSSVMDMSFAGQALAAEHLAKNRGKLKTQVITLPLELDQWIAKIKLETMGIGIDTLTPEQQKYLSSWTEGT